ncbi:hypothetical protein A2U01_0063789, partial [Trifolium medium]|nr:hypothetical protein [Trifolium medium]
MKKKHNLHTKHNLPTIHTMLEPVMTPQDFQAHNNWPGDRPQFGEGAGA